MKKRYGTLLLGNLMALMLACMLLAVGYYYHTDVKACRELSSQRDNFAEEVANSIKSGVAMEHEEMDEEIERLDGEIQALAMNTDIGRFFAKNDMSKEGRENNEKIVIAFYILFVFILCSGILNLILMCINAFCFLFKKARNDTEANHDEIEEDQDVE